MTYSDPSTQASAYLTGVLQAYGLESLSDWAMGALQRGLSAEQIIQEMRATPEFAARFPAIKQREQAGLPPISPAEYVTYERNAAQMMRDAGLPPGFWDSPDDFTTLIAADVSASELGDRITRGFTRMRYEVPEEVRDVFADWFGPSGDSALAAFFLDPDRAKPILMDMASEAFVGGTAKRFGFDVGRPLAQDIVDFGGEQRAPQTFEQLDRQRALFDETITEKTDVTEEQGVRSAFGVDGEATRQVQRRADERAAQFGGSAQPGAVGEADDYRRR